MRSVPLAALVALSLAVGRSASADTERLALAPEGPPGVVISQETEESPDGDSQEDTSSRKRHRDEEDGGFDVGDWLGSGGGFLPVALPISEPSIGIGLAGAIAYFHGQETEVTEDGSLVPPSISFVGGAGTDNGTSAAAIGHLGVWKAGRVRYSGVVLSGDVNLTLFNQDSAPDEGLAWNIRLSGTFHELKVAVRPHLFLGAQYYFFSTESSLGDDELPQAVDSQLDSELGGLGLSATYDSRNTTFSPTAGLYADATLIFHDELLGSDFTYPRFDLTAFKYWDLDRFVLGLRVEGSGVGSGGPFYGLPYLRMRGVPAFRHVGRYTALAEVEPMFRVTPRWGWVGFLAAGQNVSSSSEFGEGETVIAGGTGFRYLLARKMGLSVGLDVGWGREDTAVYFVIGTYWSGR